MKNAALLLSICMIFPSPPMLPLSSINALSQTSWQKLPQPMPVCVARPSSCLVLPLIQILAQPIAEFKDFFQRQPALFEPAH